MRGGRFCVRAQRESTPTGVHRPALFFPAASSACMRAVVPRSAAEAQPRFPWRCNGPRLHLYTALAEKERWMISQRTKEALASAKARGKQLGGLRDYGREAKRAAVERAKALAPVFELDGKSAREIARILNDRNVATPTGKPWSAMTVIRARERLARRNRQMDGDASLAPARAPRRLSAASERTSITLVLTHSVTAVLAAVARSGGRLSTLAKQYFPVFGLLVLQMLAHV